MDQKNKAFEERENFPAIWKAGRATTLSNPLRNKNWEKEEILAA